MTEPLFGSVAGSPIWPSAGLGLPQTPFPIGPVSLGPGMQGFGSPQVPMIPGSQPMEIPPSYGFVPPAYGFSGQITQPPAIGYGPPVGPALGFGVGVGPHQFSTLGGFPALQDPSIGANVLALVATVAFRRRQPMGPTNDQEIEEFIYDVLELLPGTSEVEVRCEGGRVTLTGGVQHKRLKRDVGEIAWTIPGTHDVQNNVTIATRRRARGATRETEPASAGPGRKQG
jgi:hypothetical protein